MLAYDTITDLTSSLWYRHCSWLVQISEDSRHGGLLTRLLLPSTTQYVSLDLAPLNVWPIPDAPDGIHNTGCESASLFDVRSLVVHLPVVWIT